MVDLEVLLVVTGTGGEPWKDLWENRLRHYVEGSEVKSLVEERNSVLSVESLFSSEQSLDREMNGH